MALLAFAQLDIGYLRRVSLAKVVADSKHEAITPTPQQRAFVEHARGAGLLHALMGARRTHEFPSYGAIRQSCEAEEPGLLYVAVARARRRLMSTGFAQHPGKPRF